ncbi:MAG: amidase, partial [Gammaproteobacteria bacterium]|nr:amidase [Gammaproteobacteria bacterium]
FGPEVQRRIMLGTYVLSAGYYDAYYKRALQVRRLIRREFDAAFETCHALIGPTAPGPAFEIGAKADPLAMYLCDVYTTAINLAGLPAASIPAGFVDGLPVGLQLIGNYFQEGRILRAAHRYQQATDWHLRVPEGFA